MKAFPIGLSTIEKISLGNFYYVDKTAFIETLTKEGQYYFLARPRRFGKSLLLDTLKQAFLGNRAAFTGLYLEHHWDWENQYPVIHLSFASNQLENNASTFKEKIASLLEQEALTHGISLRGHLYSVQFSHLIYDIREKYHKPVVILVDEYDKPILDVMTNTPLATEIRDILRSFYSVIKEHDHNIQFVFLTGVSKFSKAGVFSGLNNLNDITYHPKYATICGYTQHELETTFQEHLTPEDLPQIKAWYNGYYFLGDEGVYNPFSILNFFDRGKLYSNYWFSTGTPTFLINLIQQKNFYTPRLEKLEVTENSLQQFDIDQLPIATLLLQTGYLTVTKVHRVGTLTYYVLSYPNLEVKQSLNDCLAEGYVSSEIKNDTYLAIQDAFSRGEFDRIKTIFTSLFASIPHHWYRNNHIQAYEGFYCAIVYTYFMGLGYTAIAEDTTSQGQIDLTLMLDNSIVIMEFKLTTQQNTRSALEQIKAKKYAEKYLSHNKPIYLLGLSFNPEQRNMQECVFEPFAIGLAKHND